MHVLRRGGRSGVKCCFFEAKATRAHHCARRARDDRSAPSRTPPPRPAAHSPAENDHRARVARRERRALELRRAADARRERQRRRRDESRQPRHRVVDPRRDAGVALLHGAQHRRGERGDESREPDAEHHRSGRMVARYDAPGCTRANSSIPAAAINAPTVISTRAPDARARAAGDGRDTRA